MKIAYVGDKDQLADIITERLLQEGDDVFLLSPKKTSLKGLLKKDFRFYHIPSNPESYRRLVTSIGADCVIFAGSSYLTDGYSQTDELSLLRQTLEAFSEIKSGKFILLSSTEVYTQKLTNDALFFAPESQMPHPSTPRGINFFTAETLAQSISGVLGVSLTIIRASCVYFDAAPVMADYNGGFIDRLYSETAGTIKDEMTNHVYQPLNGRDLADALKRVMYDGKYSTYNVCSSATVSKSGLFELIEKNTGISVKNITWKPPKFTHLADNSLIKEELNWRDFKNLTQQLQNGDIKFATIKAEKLKKRGKLSVNIRHTIENLIIFAIFFVVAYFSQNHNVFSNINWFMIYVALTAVTYNPIQTALAALLSACGYLYNHHFSLLEAANFYQFTDSVMVIMEFVFIGFIISYTVNSLREEKRTAIGDTEVLREDYEDLKKINEENVLIKNEYERRLLSSESGFPKLYAMISRLLVQDVDRIFMEIMHIISEMMRTDTVAVYRIEENSPYLRLIIALNENSAMPGKSWNISNSPKLYEAVKNGELYQGTFGSEEPAIVLPIKSRGKTQAVILVKKLPFESESRYHINLLKTLSLLLGDSIEQALTYEDLIKESSYIEGSDIMTAEAFKKRVELAKEKADKYGSEFIVLKLLHSGDIFDTAKNMDGILRVTDCMGINESGELFALFNNTGEDDIYIINKKLSPYNIIGRAVH